MGKKCKVLFELFELKKQTLAVPSSSMMSAICIISNKLEPLQEKESISSDCGEKIVNFTKQRCAVCQAYDRHGDLLCFKTIWLSSIG